MPFPTITQITPLPPRGSDPAVFTAGYNQWFAEQPQFIDDTNAAGQYIEATAGEVSGNATAASESAALSENWATQTGSTVDGTEYSAKEHASGTTVPAGSARRWATSTSTVASGLKGARGYAQDASASASSASADATRAESAVATLPEGTIADAIIAPDKAWSSQKINSLLTLDDQLSFKSDFVRDEYFVDEGSRTFAPAEYVWDVVRASPTYALTANGKYREVPANTIARDWNPETGQYEAQISGAVTNELLWSNQFDNTAWFKQRATVVTAPSVSAPIAGAWELVADDTSNVSHYMRRTFNVTQGDVLTGSWIVKRRESRYVVVGFGDGTDWYTTASGAPAQSSFDFDSGDFSNPRSGLQVKELGNGWFLLSVTLTVSVTSSGRHFYLFLTDSETAAVESNGGDCYVAHSQLVQGTTPGPIIVTEDAPVTLPATNISRELGSEFNGSEGTIYWEGEAITPPSGTFTRIFNISDGTSSNRYEVFRDSVGLVNVLIQPAGVTVNIDPNSDKMIIALRYSATGGSLFSNGEKIDFTADCPLGLNQLRLGYSTVSGHLNGASSKIKSFPAVLSDSQMQELTQ